MHVAWATLVLLLASSSQVCLFTCTLLISTVTQYARGPTGLCLHDGPLGIRFADRVSAFPAGITAASTWDHDLILARAEALGAEFRGKGVNVRIRLSYQFGVLWTVRMARALCQRTDAASRCRGRYFSFRVPDVHILIQVALGPATNLARVVSNEREVFEGEG